MSCNIFIYFIFSTKRKSWKNVKTFGKSDDINFFRFFTSLNNVFSRKRQCRFILTFIKMYTTIVNVTYFAIFSGFSRVLKFEYQSFFKELCKPYF